MQVKIKAGQTLTEPITAALFRAYMGGTIPSSEDTLIGTMITAARLWLENHTGYSVISKSYQVEFDKSDGYENWYTLPFSPVTSITSAEIGGTAVTYSERGLNEVEIYPDSVISTGTTDNTLDVEFIAGASDAEVQMILYRIVADFYDIRKDNPSVEISSAVPTWSTMKLVNQLNNNTSI